MNQLKLKQQRIQFTCRFCLLVFENMKSRRWVRLDICPSSASACLDKSDLSAPPAVPPSYCHSIVLHVHQRNELCDFSFFFYSCILADVYCTWHHKTSLSVHLYCCQFILPCLNLCGGAYGNALLLLNISACLVLSTKEVVRPVSAAIQNKNSWFCFRNLATSLFFFSNLFCNLPHARCRISLSPISKPDWFLAGSPLYNSTFKFRNRDLSTHF